MFFLIFFAKSIFRLFLVLNPSGDLRGGGGVQKLPKKTPPLILPGEVYISFHQNNLYYGENDSFLKPSKNYHPSSSQNVKNLEVISRPLNEDLKVEYTLYKTPKPFTYPTT